MLKQKEYDAQKARILNHTVSDSMTAGLAALLSIPTDHPHVAIGMVGIIVLFVIAGVLRIWYWKARCEIEEIK